MRDLTEDELELAPDWATHYRVYEFNMAPHCIAFYNSDWRQWNYFSSGDWSPPMTNHLTADDLKQLNKLEIKND